MDKKLFSFTGKPNAGKDTLVANLQDYYKGKHKLDVVSASGMLRDVDRNSAIGKQVEYSMNNGILLADDIYNEILHDTLKKSSGDVVMLNGCIRTMSQAKPFGEGDKPLDATVFLKASDELCMSRAASRVVCEDCRTPYTIGDVVESESGRRIVSEGSSCAKCNGQLVRRTDDIDKMGVRLQSFNKETLPTIDYFKKLGKSVFELPVENKSPTQVLASTTDYLRNEHGL